MTIEGEAVLRTPQLEDHILETLVLNQKVRPAPQHSPGGASAIEEGQQFRQSPKVLNVDKIGRPAYSE
jgi:hypothetical protein